MHKKYCPSSAPVFMKFKNFVQENVKICTMFYYLLQFLGFAPELNFGTSALQTPWLHPF